MHRRKRFKAASHICIQPIIPSPLLIEYTYWCTSTILKHQQSILECTWCTVQGYQYTRTWRNSRCGGQVQVGVDIQGLIRHRAQSLLVVVCSIRKLYKSMIPFLKAALWYYRNTPMVPGYVCTWIPRNVWPKYSVLHQVPWFGNTLVINNFIICNSFYQRVWFLHVDFELLMGSNSMNTNKHSETVCKW